MATSADGVTNWMPNTDIMTNVANAFSNLGILDVPTSIADGLADRLAVNDTATRRAMELNFNEVSDRPAMR